ncbi:MAG: DNA polymerase III subunit beta [Dehalococcoidaceae bacterium]|nr:DNA polymerase III subunit beta [Dehalococcoidaceae bacterium]
MKLSCLQENLNKGLNLVGRAAAARTTLPITNNVLLSTDGGRLKLVATNLEMAISCWIGAKVDEEGAITIPARILSEFVASLPNDKVEMTLSSKTRVLEMKCARFEARMSGVDAKDFPPIPHIDDGISTTVEALELKRGIRKVAFAAAVDDSRPVLTGVNAEFDDQTLTLAAADGFRLAVYKMPLATRVSQKITAIIPSRTLFELQKLSADQEGPITIVLNPSRSQIIFRLKDIELVSQLIQGTFPQYSQLIPQSYGTRVVANVKQLSQANKTASIFARDGSGIVRLVVTPGESEVTPGKMTVSARAEELGEDTGDIDVTVQGDESKIAFNTRYLKEVLEAISEAQSDAEKQVALEITNPSSPGVFKPIDEDNYLHVIMPMFVSW